MSTEEATAYTKKDFMSDQTIRWCPGCGDYSILSQVQTVFSQLGIPREKFAVISGIGCSSRFPYYMNTYGFHTIHGRAPAFATGLKVTNPDLSVWVITGDGDALSIGGNHLIHVLRRNVDLNILLFNNRIYGLTKGQYSPTSDIGTKTKSTPQGAIDHPIDPISFALGCGATFVARTIDVDAKHMQKTLMRAHEHKGTAFVEILQNCPVFNDGAWSHVKDKAVVADAQLRLEHGQPMRFAENKGLRLNPKKLALEVVTIGEDGVTEDDILVHDETNKSMALLLANLEPPHFPIALGVLYCEPEPASYDSSVIAQVEAAKQSSKIDSIDALLRSGHTWTVE